MNTNKLYPVPREPIEYFNFSHLRYYKTHKGYFRTHEFNKLFYRSEFDTGFVEQISKKEYEDTKKLRQERINALSVNSVKEARQKTLF